jgi:hypothetical protein
VNGGPAPHPDLVPGKRVEWFRASIDEWNRVQLDFDESLAHPDFKLYSQIMGGWVAGVEEMRRWLGEIRQQFEEFKFSVDRCEELPGDRLLGLGSLSFRGSGSGVTMDMDVGWILTFRDGLVWSWRNYLTHEEALADASEPA